MVCVSTVVERGRVRVVCSVVVLVTVGETTGWDLTFTQLGNRSVTARAVQDPIKIRLITFFIAPKMPGLDVRRYGVLPDPWICKTRRSVDGEFTPSTVTWRSNRVSQMKPRQQGVADTASIGLG